MNKLIVIVVILSLGGCTTTYREALQQKLEGKNPVERRAILARECGQEIQRGLKPDDESNVQHFENMKEICGEMTGQKVPVSTSRDARKQADVNM